ncbi:MAG: DUF6173 family protein [Rhodobacteraceae bacterium]|nr:DUF6173 family protein [Paracoccaceae bacterium]
MSSEIRTTAEVAEEAALPRAHAVHADPAAPRSAELRPLPDAVARRPVAEKSPAEWAYERLILYIRTFEEQLDDRHEVAMGFAGGEAGVLRIEGLGFFAPDLISFYGTDEEGRRTQLVQHVTQLNVLLRALPRAPQHDEPRRIGFRLAADLDRR